MTNKTKNISKLCFTLNNILCLFKESISFFLMHLSCYFIPSFIKENIWTMKTN